jgi:galactokinase/mevalonate kinase-like predicted kinase
MMPEADSVHAAARMNVSANKKLSDKINYKVLDDLFEATRGAAAGARSMAAGGAGAVG